DGFLRMVPGGQVAEVAVLAQFAERGGDGTAFLVQFDDARVDIGRPGHSRGIAQVTGYLLDDPGDSALAGGVASGGGFGHGQAEGAVLVRVLFAARPEEPEVDQADRGRENPVPGQAPAVQVTADDLADARQHGAEFPDPVMLVLVPLLAPQVVVPVLAAAGRV